MHYSKKSSKSNRGLESPKSFIKSLETTELESTSARYDYMLRQYDETRRCFIHGCSAAVILMADNLATSMLYAIKNDHDTRHGWDYRGIPRNFNELAYFAEGMFYLDENQAEQLLKIHSWKEHYLMERTCPVIECDEAAKEIMMKLVPIFITVYNKLNAVNNVVI